MKNNLDLGGKLEKIICVLKDKNYLTITEIVSLTNLSRSFVRISLAKLEGAKKVGFRKIGMAKAYFLRGEK